jgi:hypothetical protein
METGLHHADLIVAEHRASDQLAFLGYCFEQAYRCVDLLSQQPVSTADLHMGEAIELLVTAGGLDLEVYGSRLVFVRVKQEPDGSLAWLAAVRTFARDESPLKAADGAPGLRTGSSARSLFDPALIPAIVIPEALQESLHTDEVTKKALWRIVSWGQYDSPSFCGGATFSSTGGMLHGLGSADELGRFERRILPGRDAAFPDEFYIEAEIFPRRWPKPVRTFVEGVFGEDRSDEFPIGMRRVLPLA